MRFSTIMQSVAVAGIALAPVMAEAEPIRAGSALPSRASAATPVRAATPTSDGSQLIGFPFFLFLGIFGTLGFIKIIVSGPRRSPG